MPHRPLSVCIYLSHLWLSKCLSKTWIQKAHTHAAFFVWVEGQMEPAVGIGSFFYYLAKFSLRNEIKTIYLLLQQLFHYNHKFWLHCHWQLICYDFFFTLFCTECKCWYLTPLEASLWWSLKQKHLPPLSFFLKNKSNATNFDGCKMVRSKKMNLIANPQWSYPIIMNNISSI